MKNMIRSTLAAAGTAALLLTGACATNDSVTDPSDRVVHVRPGPGSEGDVMAGPAIVDSDGNVYSSSAAPGSGNPATVGTNTNVNHVPEKSRVDVRETTVAMAEPVTVVEPVTTTTTVVTPAEPVTTTVVTTPVVTTTPTTTTTRTETVVVPMTSAAQEDTTPTTPRTRMRKD